MVTSKREISRGVVGHQNFKYTVIVGCKKGKRAQSHFRIIVSLYKKAVTRSHVSTHRFTQSCTNRHTTTNTCGASLNLFDTHLRGHAHFHTKYTSGAQMTCTNTKQMSSQSRWAPFCVELKASAKPVPLGRGGVHQPAEATARCPRVARVTLGLLPCHCLDQRGPMLSSRRWQRQGWA